MSVAMRETRINGRWSLLLPEHRASRPEWATGWERERWDSIFENTRAGDVVYDIGAEEGDLSALLAMWAGPAPLPEFDATVARTAGGGVCLFEPNPRVWPNIRGIFDANGLEPLSCYVGFAGDETIEDSPGQLDGTGFVAEGWPECASGELIGDHGFMQLNERPDVPRIRLDQFAIRTRLMPDLITLDVEGSEWHVLDGAAGLLRSVRPLVYASLHPVFLHDQYGKTTSDVFDLMRAHGYEWTHLATDHEQHWAFWHPDARALKRPGRDR